MKKHFIVYLFVAMQFVSCGGFKAKRVDSDEADEKALEITDQWVARDTEQIVAEILSQVRTHKGYQRYLQKSGGKPPKLFVGEVQNLTADAYFPINDINDEMLNALSASGDYILIDADARERILKEITYQNDGMVDPNQAKRIGKQTGADLMIFGNVYMKPESRDGKTLKQYSLNIRMTDIETAEEVVRTRAKLNKISKKSGWGY